MSLFVTEPRREMKITCKNCNFVSRYSVSYIEDAIHDGLRLMCCVCNEPFMIGFIPVKNESSAFTPTNGEQVPADNLFTPAAIRG
jgi:hypothetical protein